MAINVTFPSKPINFFYIFIQFSLPAINKMKNTIILVLTSTILTIVSAQSWPRCIPPDTPYKWYTTTTTSGLIHYTSTKRNVRWPDADPTCRNMVPGFSKVAEVSINDTEIIVHPYKLQIGLYGVLLHFILALVDKL